MLQLNSMFVLHLDQSVVELQHVPAVAEKSDPGAEDLVTAAASE